MGRRLIKICLRPFAGEEPEEFTRKIYGTRGCLRSAASSNFIYGSWTNKPVYRKYCLYELCVCVFFACFFVVVVRYLYFSRFSISVRNVLTLDRLFWVNTPNRWNLLTMISLDCFASGRQLRERSRVRMFSLIIQDRWEDSFRRRITNFIGQSVSIVIRVAMEIGGNVLRRQILCLSKRVIRL